jgi:hypothetical protein
MANKTSRPRFAHTSDDQPLLDLLLLDRQRLQLAGPSLNGDHPSPGLSWISAFTDFSISKGQGIVKAKIQDKEGKGHDKAKHKFAMTRQKNK